MLPSYAQNTEQLADLFAFLTSVCVDQLGEGFVDGTFLPSSCDTKGCQRAVSLVSRSCATFFATQRFVPTVFAPQLKPRYLMTLDVGTMPTPEAVYRLLRAMERNPQVRTY